MATATWTDRHKEMKQRHEFLRSVFMGQHKVLISNKAGERVEGLMHVPTDVNWLGERYTRKFSSFVMPFMPSIKTAVASDQKLIDNIVQRLRLDTLVTSIPNVVSYAGHASIKMYFSKAAGSPQLKIWGVEEGEFTYWEYLPGDDAEPIAVQFWKTEKASASNGDLMHYRVCERYERGNAREIADRLSTAALKPGVLAARVAEINAQIEAIKTKSAPTDQIVLITVDAFSVNVIGSMNDVGGQVPISQVFPDGSVPAADVWVTPYLPGYRLQNVDAAGKNRGESDYTISLLYMQAELNELTAGRRGTINFVGFPHAAVPDRFIDKASGKLRREQMQVEIDYGQNKVPVTITDWDGNLDLSAENIKILDQRFYALTPITPSLEGMDGAATSGEARKLALYPAEVAINQKRQPYKDFFEWIIGCARSMDAFLNAGKNGLGTAPTEGSGETEITTDFPPAIPPALETVISNCSTMKRDGMVSDEQYLRDIRQDWNEEQIQAELGRIKKKQEEELATQMAQAGAGAFPP